MKQDIVELLIKDNSNLRTYFDYWMEPFMEEANYEINLGTKLNCFSSALVSALNEKNINVMCLKGIFDQIELVLKGYKDKKSEDVLGVFEVMFFENILNWASNIEDNEERSYYNSLIIKSLGPISKELCENNHELWRKIILHNNYH